MDRRTSPERHSEHTLHARVGPRVSELPAIMRAGYEAGRHRREAGGEFSVYGAVTRACEYFAARGGPWTPEEAEVFRQGYRAAWELAALTGLRRLS